MFTANVISGPGREIEPTVFKKFGTVLLESIKRDQDNAYSYLFTDPVAVIQCSSSCMVPSSIDQVEDFTRKGLYAAGFLSYEAGAAWLPGSPKAISNGFPLLWFGLYEKAERFESPLLLPTSDHADKPIDNLLDMSKEDYARGVRKILRLIRDGETYQVNYTARSRFNWRYGAWQLYLRLRRSQPVPYGAFINCGKYSVVSLSPELFLCRYGDFLLTRPMKGTAPRGPDRTSDKRLCEWLEADSKNRAENRMIVDLMRNDLGQVAETGTVKVHEPFRVEHYNSVFQMTSGVKCTMRENVNLLGLMKATFPPGSITGAPKFNTMRIISRLENSPRKLYTGTIGAIGPDKNLVLNVAIRTIIAPDSGICEMGVGGGVVADSVPEKEYEEACMKARFLNDSPQDRVDIFETVLLEGDGSLLWYKEHLDRMERSAAQLGYPFCREKATTVASSCLGTQARGPAIVRLKLAETGEMSIEVLQLKPIADTNKKVMISRFQTDPADTLLRHKTTSRKFYDRELAEGRKLKCIETLFTNTNGHLTEGAFTNIFIYGELNGESSDGNQPCWYTPDIMCGLLPGIWRQKILESSGAAVAKLGIDVLSTAKSIIIGNSVRGSMEVDEVIDADGGVLYRRQDCTRLTQKIPLLINQGNLLK